MDLNNLTQADLVALKPRIDVLIAVGDALLGGGLVPRFTIAPDAASGLVRFGEVPPAPVAVAAPAAVVKESLTVDPVPAPAKPAAPAVVAAAAVAPVPVAAVPVAAAPVAPASPAPVKDAPAKLVTGPLSEAERACIIRMHEVGHVAAVIAAKLGRKIQVISLFLNRHAAVAKDPAPAAQPAPAPAPAVQAPPVQAPARAAVLASPPPAPPTPRPAPAPAALAIRSMPGVPPADRPVHAMLNAVGYLPPFDAGLDHELVAALSRGVKVPEFAADQGLDTAAVKARWVALTSGMRNRAGRMTLDDQLRLLAVLATRADFAAKAEAKVGAVHFGDGGAA